MYRSPSAFDPNRSRCAATSSPRSDAIAATVRGVISSWFGFARPSWRTATASPPHISFAPPAPKRRQRRRVRSLGSPSRVPSHPSIGSTQNRFPTRTPLTSIARASGERAGASSAASNASGMPLRSRCARKASALLSDATRGYEVRRRPCRPSRAACPEAPGCCAAGNRRRRAARRSARRAGRSAARDRRPRRRRSGTPAARRACPS